jgi:nicotinamidase-related amidase
MAKRLLVVVDYQNDFVNGTLGFHDANNVEHTIIAAIEDHLRTNDDIVFTKDTHFANYLTTLEGKYLPIMHCIKGSEGHEIHGKVKDYLRKAKKVYEKVTFGSLELANDVSKENYQEITLVGLVTNICILSNALLLKASLPEAEVIVLQTGVNSYDKELHQKTLDVLKGTQIVVK